MANSISESANLVLHKLVFTREKCLNVTLLDDGRNPGSTFRYYMGLDVRKPVFWVDEGVVGGD